MISSMADTIEEMKRKFSEILSEACPCEDKNACTCVVKTRKRVAVLKEFSDSQPKQRTQEWFDLRKTRITASDIASCLRKLPQVCKSYAESMGLNVNSIGSRTQYCNPYANEKDFILKKNGYSKYEPNAATTWGTKYETAACRFYESMTGDKVLEFGLILHKDVEWLACSPDGITEDGRMLEIKCPYRRKITGIVPLYYWIQVQSQLEICDLEECDYIECCLEPIKRYEFTSLRADTKRIMAEKTETQSLHSQGLLIRFGDSDMHMYPPRKYQTCGEMMEWAERKCIKYEKLKPCVEYYKIKEFSMTKIVRDREWFAVVKPMLERTWEKVKCFNVDDYKEYIDQKTKEKEKGKHNDHIDLRENVFTECVL